jgi:hypothetical protein
METNTNLFLYLHGLAANQVFSIDIDPWRWCFEAKAPRRATRPAQLQWLSATSVPNAAREPPGGKNRFQCTPGLGREDSLHAGVDISKI